MSIRTKEMVEIQNLDSKPYREVFKDEEIEIPANGSVKMTRSMATLFMGTHPGMDPKLGRPITKNLKKIRLGGQNVETRPEFRCPKTNKLFETQEELDEHLKQFKDEVVKDEELDKIISEKKPKAEFLDCPLCKTKVRGKLGLEMHLKKCKG